jgi:hypothetical protein
MPPARRSARPRKAGTRPEASPASQANESGILGSFFMVYLWNIELGQIEMKARADPGFIDPTD